MPAVKRSCRSARGRHHRGRPCTLVATLAPVIPRFGAEIGVVGNDVIMLLPKSAERKLNESQTAVRIGPVQSRDVRNSRDVAGASYLVRICPRRRVHVPAPNGELRDYAFFLFFFFSLFFLCISRSSSWPVGQEIFPYVEKTSPILATPWVALRSVSLRKASECRSRPASPTLKMGGSVRHAVPAAVGLSPRIRFWSAAMPIG